MDHKEIRIFIKNQIADVAVQHPVQFKRICIILDQYSDSFISKIEKIIISKEFKQVDVYWLQGNKFIRYYWKYAYSSNTAQYIRRT